MDKKEEAQPLQEIETVKEKAVTKVGAFGMPASFAASLADEIAKTVIQRLPHMIAARRERNTAKKKASKTIENGIFLDTSAIIDGRIFEVANIGLLNGIFVIPESILLELKHIADSQDMVKRERGRGGLDALDKLKKSKKIKVTVVPNEEQKTNGKKKEVDEQLIDIAKHYKGKIITCDYNLEKKASIHGVTTVNMNALAQSLKISAVPGESLHIKILHPGKDVTQGVGYLDDGTMLVVEQGSGDVGKMVDVVVSRVIQTVSGRILFAKKI